MAHPWPSMITVSMRNNSPGNLSQWIYVHIRLRTVKTQFCENNQGHSLKFPTFYPWHHQKVSFKSKANQTIEHQLIAKNELICDL